MLKKLKDVILGFALKKWALGYLVQAYEWSEGYKTQASIAAMVAITIFYLLGWMDEGKWSEAMAFLSGLGGLSFAEKLKRQKNLLSAIRKK